MGILIGKNNPNSSDLTTSNPAGKILTGDIDNKIKHDQTQIVFEKQVSIDQNLFDHFCSKL